MKVKERPFYLVKSEDVPNRYYCFRISTDVEIRITVVNGVIYVTHRLTPPELSELQNQYLPERRYTMQIEPLRAA